MKLVCEVTILLEVYRIQKEGETFFGINHLKYLQLNASQHPSAHIAEAD
jgi:hypothetical protein